MMTFHLALEPEILTARLLCIVGENHPISDDPFMRIEADDAVPGHLLRIEGVVYVVDGVEVDRVWIRPMA